MTRDCRAFCCQVCDGHATWDLLRRGDAVCSWACNDHLPRELLRLQRAHERTVILVTVNETHPDPIEADQQAAGYSESEAT